MVPGPPDSGAGRTVENSAAEICPSLFGSRVANVAVSGTLPAGTPAVARSLICWADGVELLLTHAAVTVLVVGNKRQGAAGQHVLRLR